LSNKFRSATVTSSFMKGNESNKSNIPKYFLDDKKNSRYIDYLE